MSPFVFLVLFKKKRGGVLLWAMFGWFYPMFSANGPQWIEAQVGILSLWPYPRPFFPDLGSNKQLVAFLWSFSSSSFFSLRSPTSQVSTIKLSVPSSSFPWSVATMIHRDRKTKHKTWPNCLYVTFVEVEKVVPKSHHRIPLRIFPSVVSKGSS